MAAGPRLTGAVSWTHNPKDAVAQARAAMIHRVACIPNASAANPAQTGPRVPPMASPTPMPMPRTVPTNSGRTLSAGMVAITMGKVPVIADPAANITNEVHRGPGRYPVASGSIMPRRVPATTTGLRPQMSELPGIKMEYATEASPKDAMNQLLVVRSTPAWVNRTGANVTNIMTNATSSADMMAQIHTLRLSSRLRMTGRAVGLRVTGVSLSHSMIAAALTKPGTPAT